LPSSTSSLGLLAKRLEQKGNARHKTLDPATRLRQAVRDEHARSERTHTTLPPTPYEAYVRNERVLDDDFERLGPERKARVATPHPFHEVR